MFGIFNRESSKANVIDKVWMTQAAKWNACKRMAEIDFNCIFIAWFDDTFKALNDILQKEEMLIKADKIDLSNLQNRMVVFLEHYPLVKKETTLFMTLQRSEIPVLSSLDEPLFMRFGGERTIELMKKLGMNEDEVIGSPLITKSIRNAQQKIEKKVLVEHMASSQEEWFSLNLAP